jgi:hypothetical protein
MGRTFSVPQRRVGLSGEGSAFRVVGAVVARSEAKTSSAAAEVTVPCRMDWPVMPNQVSIWLIEEDPTGVKWKCTCGLHCRHDRGASYRGRRRVPSGGPDRAPPRTEPLQPGTGVSCSESDRRTRRPQASSANLISFPLKNVIPSYRHATRIARRRASCGSTTSDYVYQGMIDVVTEAGAADARRSRRSSRQLDR